jgi:hypothetical protein
MGWSVSLHYPHICDLRTFNNETWPQVHRWLRDTITGEVQYHMGLVRWSNTVGHPLVKADEIIFERKTDATLFVLFWAEMVEQIRETPPVSPPSSLWRRLVAAGSPHTPPAGNPSN